MILEQPRSNHLTYIKA